MLENFDYSTMQTGDIMVSACQELLEGNESRHELWGYMLRIENNSNERIRLLAKDLCITDENGNSRCLPSAAAVIYGYCKALTIKGKELKIKLPVINLSSSKNSSVCFC